MKYLSGSSCNFDAVLQVGSDLTQPARPKLSLRAHSVNIKLNPNAHVTSSKGGKVRGVSRRVHRFANGDKIRRNMSVLIWKSCPGTTAGTSDPENESSSF